MAAPNPRPFVCQRQDCPYGAKRLSNMVSHIVYMHLSVQPFKCAEPNCTVTCPRLEPLETHVAAAHTRALLPAEKAADAAIVAAVRNEAKSTRVVPRTQHAAPPPPPPAPRAVDPLFAPLFDPPLVAPPAAPIATPLDALEQPGYFFFHEVPYGTGLDIPGGRR